MKMQIKTKHIRHARDVATQIKRRGETPITERVQDVDGCYHWEVYVK